MRRKITTLTTILLIGCGAALAQAARDPGGSGPGSRRISADDGARPEDLCNLDRLEAIATRFEEARAASDERGVSAVNDDLRRAAAGELRRAKEEDRRRAREARTAPKELSLSIMVDPPPAGGDGGPDPSAAAWARERRLEIAVRLRHLQDSMASADLDAERALIAELIYLARQSNPPAKRGQTQDRREEGSDPDRP